MPLQKVLFNPIFKENVHGISCHVGKHEDREKLIEETLRQFGAIDILVSNAGTNPHFGPMLEVKPNYLLLETI